VRGISGVDEQLPEFDDLCGILELAETRTTNKYAKGNEDEVLGPVHTMAEG
jgi:hypothetical protein